jgi:hypothetical protein
MSLAGDTPLAGVDGWSVRSCLVGGREQHWLERTIDAATGHVEQFHGHYGYASRSSDAPARLRTATPAAPVVRPRPERTVRREVAPTVARRSRPSGLTVTVGAGALETIHREIRAQRRAIEEEQLETGGGLFGPPLRSWTTQAQVAIATVAAASRGRGEVEIAYGEIEATESSLIRVHGSHLRRLGDFHVHPRCPVGRIGEPSDTDMRTWLSELDRIDHSRSATRYLGIIATVGVRGWSSKPRLHAWVVSRDNRGRPICEPATLTESRYARAA